MSYIRDLTVITHPCPNFSIQLNHFNEITCEVKAWMNNCILLLHMDILSYTLFADMDKGIYPYAASQNHTHGRRPSVDKIGSVAKRCASHVNTATSNDRHGVLNYRSIECLFNSLLRLTTRRHQRSASPSLCEGNQINWCLLPSLLHNLKNKTLLSASAVPHSNLKSLYTYLFVYKFEFCINSV